MPVLGRIVAGEPIPIPPSDFQYFGADESIEIAMSLMPAREKGKELFALEVQGNSMIDAMVNDGDIVIMRATQDARNGDMVAVWLPDKNETTLKYFYKDRDGFRLQPANPTYKPIMLKKDAPLEIKGKVVMVIRKVAAGKLAELRKEHDRLMRRHKAVPDHLPLDGGIINVLPKF